MIRINDLVFSYNGKPSDNAAGFRLEIDEFNIPTGASAALVGPSGSGKTTLLGLIAGTLRPAEGAIDVNDRTITGLSDTQLGQFRIRYVGQVFQSFELLNYLTVIENIMLPWYIGGRGKKAQARARAKALLNNIGLGTRALSRPGELSQGEQQRVAVCRAMLNNPPLLLADEPTGNLDRQNKQNVVDLLREQAREEQSTLLMVTHDESLLARFDTVLDIGGITRASGQENKA
jgi:putative ABC transport system ATP-binding protein